jgi:hypothetical protein
MPKSPWIEAYAWLVYLKDDSFLVESETDIFDPKGSLFHKWLHVPGDWGLANKPTRALCIFVATDSQTRPQAPEKWIVEEVRIDDPKQFSKILGRDVGPISWPGKHDWRYQFSDEKPNTQG